jgi:hypothetical protein
MLLPQFVLVDPHHDGLALYQTLVVELVLQSLPRSSLEAQGHSVLEVRYDAVRLLFRCKLLVERAIREQLNLNLNAIIGMLLLLLGVMPSMIESAADLDAFRLRERAAGLPEGYYKFAPLIETPAALVCCTEIACAGGRSKCRSCAISSAPLTYSIAHAYSLIHHFRATEPICSTRRQS